MKNVKIAMAVCLALILTACTASDLTLALNAVADAASVAAIAGTLLDGPAGTLVATYAGQVSAVIPEVQTELNSSDPLPTKINKIAKDFADVVVPDVGGSPQMKALVDAISAAIQAFLGQLHLQVPKAAAITHFKLSYGDRHEVARAVATANKTVAYLHAHKK